MSNKEIEITRIDTADVLITVSLRTTPDGGLVVFDYYIGPFAEKVYGADDVEVWLTLPPTSVQGLHAVLGLAATDAGTRADELAAFLAVEYRGQQDALSQIEKLCLSHDVACERKMWA